MTTKGMHSAFATPLHPFLEPQQSDQQISWAIRVALPPAYSFPNFPLLPSDLFPHELQDYLHCLQRSKAGRPIRFSTFLRFRV